MADPPSLVFVCVDCLRGDFALEGIVHTPTIDGLAERGLVCTDMHSTTTTTTPSVAGLFTGTYAERNGVNSLQRCDLQEDVETLAELFGRAGYETAAFVTGPLVEDTGLDRGFDIYDHREEDLELVGDWRSTLVDELAGLEEPFFAYVHLWEIHKPIEVPEDFDDEAHGSTPYERQLAALDLALDRLLAELPEDTAVAIHGDHGESITFRDSWPRKVLKKRRRKLRYERGIDTRSLERRVNRLMDRRAPDYRDHYLEDGHGETVYDFMTNVPFVLAGPGVPSATITAQCRQIDVLPTLVDIFDLPAQVDPDGESLAEPEEVEDRPAYVRACGTTLYGEANWQRGIRHGGYKLVTYPERDWPHELYDLEQDPKELAAVDDPETERELEALLPKARLLPSGQLEIQERLEDLGYL